YLSVINFIDYFSSHIDLYLIVLKQMNQSEDTEPMKSNLVKIMGVIAGMCLFATLLGAFRVIEPYNELVTGNTEIGLVKHLGNVLFNEFLLPFEISAILLLIAMIGAVLLAKK